MVDGMITRGGQPDRQAHPARARGPKFRGSACCAASAAPHQHRRDHRLPAGPGGAFGGGQLTGEPAGGRIQLRHPERWTPCVGGGFPAGTSTSVMGPSGTGKTSMGLHFVSGSSADEPGLIFGFYETPQQLGGQCRRARARPPRPGGARRPRDPVAAGAGTGPRRPGGALIEAVERRGVKRLVVDRHRRLHPGGGPAGAPGPGCSPPSPAS